MSARHSFAGRTAPPRRRVSRGFSTVAAIFLLVVLAALGAAMLRFSNMQHAGEALDIEGERAYQAARAGVEWGMYRLLIDNTCPASATTVTLPAVSSLSGYYATVTCSSTAVNSVISPFTMYKITSVGCNLSTCPGSGVLNRFYVERQLEVTVSK